MTNIEEIVDSKELREQYISRTEVLDKVKKLFLIPKLDMMTSRQVAEYYGVDNDAIRQCYKRNYDEIETDGTSMKKPNDFKDFLNVTTCHTQKQRGSITFDLSDGVTIQVPNVGIRCFSKRAVLRFGMLLRDSEIAKEVRTQLLNVFEKAETGESVNVVEEIDREQELLNNITMAYVSGNRVEILQAASAHAAYLKRKNTELANTNKELTEKNELLTEDNNILAGDILAWSNRASANKIVRLMATRLDWKFGKAWKEIYDQLSYHHGISLTMRWAHDGKPKSKPLLSYLHDDEWDKFYKTVAAMLQTRYVNPSKIFAQAKLELKESDEKD